MRLLAASCVLILTAACSAMRAAPEHKASDEQSEVMLLIPAGTADSLATASLLAHLTPAFSEAEKTGDAMTNDPSALIQKAVALAPDRPELVWLQLRDCQQRRCAEERQIAARLQSLDPDNGLAWLTDLRMAPSLSAPEMTQAIERMGNSKNPQLYWNKLVVTMYDALTHGSGSRPATAITFHPDDRLAHVMGILGAVDSPAFQTLALACRSDQFEAPGRRAACAQLMARLEISDAVLLQNLSLTLQEGWWSAGSPEREALRRKHLQQRYLTEAAGRVRDSRADSDAELRVDAMRRLQREEDVERAMLSAFHEPLERPADWQGPPAA
jgi:hypothetical protein